MEVIQRKKYTAGEDPIEDFSTVIIHKGIENIIVSVVKRRSGTFDLYYEGSRVYTSKKGKY